ncbi:unnamed protein product [Prunus armeniaca]|uniref:Uncharacterized protein n=1 Tax=Prunus armeniaca TaxID=36596 RepID=A0A6J5UM83_PRUAR|nr:unnamed protein product [Prunus armeniaca]CAB4308008.1 unnamed protein product [Prunus armeniaca]
MAWVMVWWLGWWVVARGLDDWGGEECGWLGDGLVAGLVGCAGVGGAIRKMVVSGQRVRLPCLLNVFILFIY